VLVAAIFIYAAIGGSWLLFAVLILAPDLSMAGYAGGPRIGAAVYNLFHTLAGPALLAFASHFGLGSWMLPVALIWLAHIAADRMLGYGLKLPTGFRDTHMGRIGRD